MKGSLRQTRLLLRYTHLVIGAMLSAYVYLPPAAAEPLQPFLMFVGVPVVGLSGVVMWKRAALRRLLRRLPPLRRGRSAARPA